jgi:hypothetical protein
MAKSAEADTLITGNIKHFETAGNTICILTHKYVQGKLF